MGEHLIMEVGFQEAASEAFASHDHWAIVLGLTVLNMMPVHNHTYLELRVQYFIVELQT